MRTSTVPTREHPAPARGDRVLLVLGGLPGSGKTTLMRRLLAERVPGVVGVDSEQVAAALHRTGLRVPYRLLRPWVHAWHRVRVLRALGGAAVVVVLTDPWTSPAWRSLVLRTARGAGRSVRVVLLDATPEQARHGQAVRGRALPARMMRRHTARWGAVLDAAGEDRPGVGRAVVVDRVAATALTLSDVLGRTAEQAGRC